MRSRFISKGVVAVVGAIVLSASAAWADRVVPDFVPGELLVKFRDGTNAAARSDVLARAGARVEQQFSLTGAMLVSVSGDTLASAAAIARSPAVAYAEPNYILSIGATPNDPDYPSMWGLNNTGQTGGTPDADIDAPEAWDVQTGSSSVLVGVIDSGIDIDHPDLVGNLWTNPGEIAGNGVDDDSNGYVDDIHGINAITGSGNPDDDNGHGTHCSGTIGASANNANQVVGVAWDVEILGCKFLNSAGSGSTDDAIECVQYTTAMGVDISSNSWGGGGFSQALKDAIDAADSAGILFMAAAGNGAYDNDATPSYPASYASDNIVAVASTDHNDALSGFSQWGATSVDVAAPGTNILSTWFGGGTNTISGTSMATPHVAGLAALMLSESPTTSHDDVKQTLIDTVDSLGLPVLSGGRINALAALNGLCTPPTIADAGPDHTICPGDSAALGTPAQSGHTYSWAPGGETAAQISVSPVTETTYTLTANTAVCGDNEDSATVFVVDPSAIGLSEDFEGGLGGWTTSGLWHLVADSSCASPGYSSPVNAAYYGQDAGCTYDTGAQTTGSLTSPVIYGIDASSTLTFDFLRTVESFAGAYDVTTARILTSDGSSTVWARNSGDPSAGTWSSSGAISLAAFAGKAIQVQFVFDSVDGVSNAFLGWFVDDVVVTATDPCTGGPTCTDNDADGYSIEGGACGAVDCNDGNPAVNPGAGEICNGIDDNCNAATDEGFDTDSDGWTTCAGDCDDGNPSVNPGQAEIPGNGVDDDCNPSTPGGCEQELAEASLAPDGDRPTQVPFDVVLYLVAAGMVTSVLRRRVGRRARNGEV